MGKNEHSDNRKGKAVKSAYYLTGSDWAERKVEQTAKPGSVPVQSTGRAAKAAVVIAFAGMITINGLANLLPINGITTGQVSDSYPNLFTPAGLTFAIWGLIYLLLALYMVYQLKGRSVKNPEASETQLLPEGISPMGYTRFFFVLSSIANVLWILAWHYHLLQLSIFLILTILISLMVIHHVLKKTDLTAGEKFFVRLPFSVYFGWITVATIANITALLVGVGWDGWGLAPATWTMIIVVVATLIAIAVISTSRDIAYGAVILWAFVGILVRHLDPVAGFDSNYPQVIVTVGICLGLLVLSCILALTGRHRHPVSDKHQKE